ncbi:hypothetical protein AB0H17_29290 [Streptomyces olivoreticuli]
MVKFIGNTIVSIFLSLSVTSINTPLALAPTSTVSPAGTRGVIFAAARQSEESSVNEPGDAYKSKSAVDRSIRLHNETGRDFYLVVSKKNGWATIDDVSNLAKKSLATAVAIAGGVAIPAIGGGIGAAIVSYAANSGVDYLLGSSVTAGDLVKIVKKNSATRAPLGDFLRLLTAFNKMKIDAGSGAGVFKGIESTKLEKVKCAINALTEGMYADVVTIKGEEKEKTVDAPHLRGYWDASSYASMLGLKVLNLTFGYVRPDTNQPLCAQVDSGWSDSLIVGSLGVLRQGSEKPIGWNTGWCSKA